LLRLLKQGKHFRPSTWGPFLAKIVFLPQPKVKTQTDIRVNIVQTRAGTGCELAELLPITMGVE